MLVAIVEDWFQHNLFRSNLGPLPSWVFMSSSTTKRTSSNHGIMGDEYGDPRVHFVHSNWGERARTASLIQTQNRRATYVERH